MAEKTVNLFSRLDSGRLVELEGQVQRITYCDQSTGYTVAKMKVPGHPDLVTVVGNMASVCPGEQLSLEGRWEHHPKFGAQFRIKGYRTILPTSEDAIAKYLGSGLIKGIGPVMAKRIVDMFGEKTLEVIDQRIHELEKVAGLGKKRIETIKEAWKGQKEVSTLMVFLKSHGVGPALATKIFQKFGHDAISIITKNPYRLAEEIHGVGFLTADKLAFSMGVERNSPQRIESGILYVLGQMAEQGHVYYPYEDFIKKCSEVLNVDRDVVTQGFGQVALKGKIVIEDLNERLEEFNSNLKAIYLAKLHHCETSVARQVLRLLDTTASGRDIDWKKAVHWVQKRAAIRFTANQLEAVRKSLTEKFLIITGGPGTGKTTVIRAIIEIYRAAGFSIALAAPTGRASKRMQEATGVEAKTIHRLLEFNRQKGGFQRNGKRPLEADIIIIDEVSMMDIALTNRLLAAVKPGARMILVGDADQLPSVGPGNVLRDLIKSQVVPVVRLEQIFRQAKQSLIVLNAHRINKGHFPVIPDRTNMREDFYFIEQESPDQVFRTVMELASRRIPKRFGMDPIRDIQVLTPMHKGMLGTEHLNKGLQELLNSSRRELKVGERIFREQDKVMQIRNDYEKEVFNGDIGIISSVGEDQVQVSFEERLVPYKVYELDDLVHAYAISVHKSQGSEYRAVILPILSEHYLLLQRNLVYTGVTRARELLILIGSKKALNTAIRNNKTAKRYTHLANRLREFQ